MKQHGLYIKITAMLAVIAIGAMGFSYLLNSAGKGEETPSIQTPSVSDPNGSDTPADDGVFTVVTSFYPVYTMASTIADGIEGVQVINLVDNHAGCLHDYSMTVEDRKVLQNADVLVINGAGAEPFLDTVLDTMPHLKVIDLSEELELIESGEDHEHMHENVSDHTHNSHVWVSPRQYAAQFNRLIYELAQLDSAHAAQYVLQGAPIQEQVIHPLVARIEEAAGALDGVPTVLLHDSMAYLARDLGLHTVASLNVGEEAAVDSHALKNAEDALRSCKKALILGDAQYGVESYLTAICADTTVIQVDIVVSGEDPKNDWVTAMTAFCESLEAAA